MLSKVLGRSLWGLEHQKFDVVPIFSALEFNPQIWGYARTVKISAKSIFCMPNPPKRFCAHLYYKNVVRPQNMGAELPVLRICNPHPCLCKHIEIRVLCTNTRLAAKYVLLGVQRPYFACIRARGPGFMDHIG